MNKPLVSVIVPSFNSQKTIAQCLESLKKQTYRRIEIILVDRSSNDDTRELARRYTSKIYISGPERSAQVNFGAMKAKGKYLYRVDSDFILEREVIKQCVQKCETDHIDGIAVHNTSAVGLGFWAEVRKFERNSYIDDDLIVAVRFFTKKSWHKLRGFDESLYGPEDYDFHNRFVQAGFKWVRIKSVEYHLGEPKKLSDIWRKHYFYGRQMVAYYRKHPDIALKQFNPIRSSYFRHYKTFLVRPILTMGLIIMTCTKFMAGGLGFLTEYLNSGKRNLKYSK